MDVVIAGAGISGLATAISLRRSGHKVTIYERSSLNNEVGAAILVPPNAGRFLVPWGLDPVRMGFVPSKGMYLLSPKTLDLLMFHDHSFNKHVFGQPLYQAHRVDLHESLKQLATDPNGPGTPVVVHLNSSVASYDPETPSLTLQDGTVVTADLIVAADGVNSIATGTLNGKANAPEAMRGDCCYRFLIPKAELAADPETSWFNEGEQSLSGRIFPDVQNHRRIIVYGCRNNEIYNFVAICRNEDVVAKKEDWHAAVNKAEVLEKFEGYNPKLMALINKATEVKRWPLLYRPPIQTWIKGNMALTGDAAHPMLPNLGQGGAQGMEDGLALGLVMYGATKASDVPARLAIYEKIRRNRAAAIQVLSKVGVDEARPPELVEFLDGRPIPMDPKEVHMFACGEDVLKSTVAHMTEFDPTWSVPEAFFPANVENIQTKEDTAKKRIDYEKNRYD